MQSRQRISGMPAVEAIDQGTTAVSPATVSVGGGSGGQAEAQSRALILYDFPAQAPFRKLGSIYAIMLQNLLGHFPLDTDVAAVEDYAAGSIEDYAAVFYIGASYDNPLPAAFLSDAMKTTKTVVWFKYNLWQLTWYPQWGFAEKFGFSFDGLRGMNAPPSPQDPAPGFFDTVVYNGKSLVKFYQFDADSLSVLADPEIGITRITDSQKAKVRVPINNPKTGEIAPYVIQAGNFWYFADVPLSFIGPQDRYLALCDILHDILNINHAVNRQAMVRLEDVGALVKPASMRRLVDYLHRRGIPFSMAVIPNYEDPFGKYNGGVSQHIPLAEARNLIATLRYALRYRGAVIMHGNTHQYDATFNPHSAVSGDDFEFWDIVANAPVAEDSVEWAAQRIQSGLADFQKNGFFPTMFEFPHYQGSPRSYQAAGESFTTRYERSFYYTSDQPNLNLDSTDPERDFLAGQFFPYVIYKDAYGQKVVPENLGNIEYDIRQIDPISNVNYPWTEVLKNADYARVVRDGTASFFFHPFWLDPKLDLPAFNDFRKLILGITSLGYKWVGAADAK